MNKRTLIGAALGVSVAMAFGGLYASNMGFKLNQLLQTQTPGVSRSGQTQVGLPYNPQTSLSTVADLFNDINATAGVPGCVGAACAVIRISRFVRSTDALQSYAGGTADLPNVYPLDGVEGQRILVRQNVNYIIVGSHDPGRVVSLDAPGTNGSKSGQTEWSFPYHGTATNVSQLRDEINAASASGNAVIRISRFLKSSDALQSYAGGTADLPNIFPTAPGESYRILVSEDVAYVPSHY